MNTKRLVTATLSLVASSVLASTAFAATAAAPALNSQMDKVSYAIGYNLGTSFQQQNINVSADALQQGLNAAISKSAPAMTPAEMQSTLQDFQKQMVQQMMAQQQQAADTNAKASAEFMANIAKQSGVAQISNGVYYKVIKAGTGAVATANDSVTVNYKGMLPNGTVFDSSYDRHQPATFPLSQVIPGFSAALAKMPVGSTWMVYIAPDQAYGKNAPASIGPNQALQFQIELLSIQQPAKASS